jgi:hypothetical protein
LHLLGKDARASWPCGSTTEVEERSVAIDGVSIVGWKGEGAEYYHSDVYESHDIRQIRRLKDQCLAKTIHLT